MAQSIDAKIWIVGGAIRDFFTHNNISDIDFVTDIDIKLFEKEISKKNFKTYRHNIQYKTISILLGKKEYQITSFRKDLITFGRQAIVGTADNLYQDALRRDFTINAIYLDRSGVLIDPLGGLNDIVNKKLKFIGNPLQRIEEDYLRIIRFCRFFSVFSCVNLSYKLKKTIQLKSNKVKTLSNKRIKDEFAKIFNAKKFDKCLSIMSQLQIDKSILLDDNNEGFKIKNFDTIIYISQFGSNIINKEKLDLNSVLIPHLFGFARLNGIINRFEFNKNKINFNEFAKQLLSLSYLYNESIFEIQNAREKEINVMKLIWKMRCYIFPKNKTLFIHDRVPFNWYKIALFHIIPLEQIKLINLCDITWPTFPINRQQIKGVFKKKDYVNINYLINKGEHYWVNSNFKSSSNQILDFLKISENGDYII